MGVVEIKIPCKTVGLDRHGRERELDTARLHISHVGHLRYHATGTLSIGGTDEVKVVTLVVVGNDRYAVTEESHINTDVELMLLFVGEFLISDVGNVNHRLSSRVGRTPEVGSLIDGCGIGHVCRTRIGS